MLSYTTPASIARNNAEADRIMREQAQRHTGVDRDAIRGHRDLATAQAHADALDRRNRG